MTLSRMTETQRKVLDALQGDLPDDPEPYDILARRAAMPVGEFLKVARELLRAAETLVGAMKAKLAEVARRVAGRQPLRVFFEVRYQNLLGAGRGSLVNDIITRAGGVNIVDSPQKLSSYNLEALLQADPEVYIIQQGPMNRSPEDIYGRPYFQELQAVRRHRVLVVEESLFSRPGPRSAEAVEQLARFLHPEAWEKGKGDR